MRIKNAITVLNRGLGQSRTAYLSDHDTRATPNITSTSDGSTSDKRHGNSLLEIQAMQEILGRQTRFLKWYVDFLRAELAPSASYQRHVTGLKAVVPVLKDFAAANDAVDLSTGSLIFGDEFWIRSILDFIVNAFDDVRDTAISILMLFPEDIIAPSSAPGERNLLESLEEFCTRASELATRTTRGDHADGAARSLGLLCKWLPTLDRRVAVLSSVLDDLEKKLSLAERDLGRAVVENPVHGGFASIRYAGCGRTPWLKTPLTVTGTSGRFYLKIATRKRTFIVSRHLRGALFFRVNVSGISSRMFYVMTRPRASFLKRWRILSASARKTC